MKIFQILRFENKSFRDLGISKSMRLWWSKLWDFDDESLRHFNDKNSLEILTSKNLRDFDDENLYDIEDENWDFDDENL